MKETKEVTMYLCPKCDRSYYSVDRQTWEGNRNKHNAIARSLKSSHRCPWEKRRNK